ncbi:MAG: hypothetical protein WBF53_08370 [Litorimonas sp.]
MSRARQTLFTWAVVYPLITALLWAGGDWLSPLPLAARTLIVTALLVPIMDYMAMPTARRLLQRVNHH